MKAVLYCLVGAIVVPLLCYIGLAITFWQLWPADQGMQDALATFLRLMAMIGFFSGFSAYTESRNGVECICDDELLQELLKDTKPGEFVELPPGWTFQRKPEPTAAPKHGGDE